MDAKFEFHVTIGNWRWEAEIGSRIVQESEYGVVESTIERDTPVSDFNEFVLWCLGRIEY
jgi:hypothetical protein